MLARLQNSTLVLTSDNKSRGNREPTGEPVTLANRNLPKMGDRAGHTKPDEDSGAAKKKYAPQIRAHACCAHLGHLPCVTLAPRLCVQAGTFMPTPRQARPPQTQSNTSSAPRGDHRLRV